MAGKELDAETKAYLETLPAVESVMSGRIYYNDAFKDYVVQRCEAGDSPTRIFRAAGLGPSIIGRKRIERCVARWRTRAARAEASHTEVFRTDAVPSSPDSRDPSSASGITNDSGELTGENNNAATIADATVVGSSKARNSGGTDGVVVSADAPRASSANGMSVTSDGESFVPGGKPRGRASGRTPLASDAESFAPAVGPFAPSGTQFAPDLEPFAPRTAFDAEPFAPTVASSFESSGVASQQASLVALNRRIDTMEALLRQQLRHMQHLEDDLALLRSRLAPQQ
ncbi:hypothetical protein [Bifidobacterium callimiconis]|uniref:Transposase n=1 Tax=Bifidobacterium callimiconis TaxID=2306973 RepID=A0A430FB41_9BIFI|nr:hypothetical protein [Bifidobacterium callimiconis]RSX50045.1 transposase [Bifidobacterium callimiconis]